MRIALFLGCFNDLLAPRVGKAVVEVVERLGQTVVFPENQTCCGQIHFNSGYRAEARHLGRAFVRTFEVADLIVCPSASCAGMVRFHLPELLAEADPILADAAAEIAGRTLELTELLVDRLGVVDVGARFPHAVALHPTCHSLRALRLGDRPRRLLEAVAALRLVELADAEGCCGFGGTFAVKNAAVSVAMGRDKVAAIVAAGAEVVTAVDTSCLLHIGGLLHRERRPIRTLHLAEILAAREADR
jgi:L-lactate dehydrogenase complex protein LldE